MGRARSAHPGASTLISLPICVICDNSPQFDIGAYVEQSLKVAAVTGFAARQVESERETIQVRLDISEALYSSMKFADQL